MGIYKTSRVIFLSTTFLTPFAAPPPANEGALALLDGETQGFAIDATTYDTVGSAPLYVGGPVGGTVAVIDTGTPANDLSNVALDSSNLVQSGTSPKMVNFPSSPYVRWSPHNYVLQSQDLSAWANANTTETTNATTAPDGSSTADEVFASGAGTNRRIRNGTLSIDSQVHCASVYAKASVTDWIVLWSTDGGTWAFGSYFDLTNGVTGSSNTFSSGVVIDKGIEDAGNGWYRCWVVGTSGASTTNASAEVGLAEADNDDDVADGDSIYLWGGQLNKGYTLTPYLATTTAARIGIPQSYDAAEAMYGILVEPAATNNAVRSEQFDTTWATQNASVGSDATTAPDGQTTADTLTASAGSNIHNVYNNVGGSVDATPTAFSVYAKAGTNSYVVLTASNFGDDENCIAAVFDLSNGAATSASETDVGTTSGAIVSTKQEAIGGGWFRIMLVGTLAHGGGSAYHLIGHAGAATGNTFTTYGELTFNAAGTETIHIWGAQQENGPVVTSYIPTLGSTVTRGGDLLQANTSTIPDVSAAVSGDVLFKPFLNQEPQLDWTYLLVINNGSDFIRFRADDPGYPSMELTVSGGVAAVGLLGVAPLDTLNHGAFSAEEDSFNLAVNGTLGTRDTSGTYPDLSAGLWDFAIGPVGNPLMTMFYKVTILPRVMDDTELATRTTP